MSGPERLVGAGVGGEFFPRCRCDFGSEIEFAGVDGGDNRRIAPRCPVGRVRRLRDRTVAFDIVVAFAGKAPEIRAPAQHFEVEHDIAAEIECGPPLAREVAPQESVHRQAGAEYRLRSQPEVGRGRRERRLGQPAFDPERRVVYRRAIPLRIGQHIGEAFRSYGVVGIEIGDETPAGRTERDISRRPVAAAGPPGGDLPYTWVGAAEHGRIVLAVVGGEDHLDVVERLGKRAFDGLADRCGSLETRDQNADRRC